MKEKGEDYYSSGSRDRSRNGNRSRRGGDRVVEFDGHSSDGGSFSGRRMLGRRLKDGGFIVIEGRLCIFQVLFRYSRVFFGRIPFPSDQWGAIVV